MPQFIPPMLAKLAPLPVDDTGWAFEIKWDGIRAVGRVESGKLTLMSRNGNDVTRAYPELQGLAQAVGDHELILDGEIVGFDPQGRVSFQALQPRMHVRDEQEARSLAQHIPVTYMLFDLLWLDGRDLTPLPYVERRAQLSALKLDDERWQVPEFVNGDGAHLLSVTREHQLEGVVAKRLDSRYVPGRRVGWSKIKNSQRQEAVIGGWTSGQGGRRDHIGALHLGVYDGNGELRYAGRVGTGFGFAELELLGKLLAPLARDTSPFTGRQPTRGAHFVEPKLVCEVEFSEWTRDGTLRQASYKGLRDDKPAADVVRERPQAPQPSPAASSDDDDSAMASATSDSTVASATHDSTIASATGGSAAAAANVSSPRTTASSVPAAATRFTDVQGLIENGRRVRQGVEIELDGRRLTLSNLDKVLYPASGFTKGDLIRFYAAISPVLLPHLKDRPLTLKRYPDGIAGKFFYEKRSPKHRPDWVQTVTIDTSRGEVPFTLCQDLTTLVWLANLADIELHPLLSTAAAVNCPTAIVFDLDPGAPADITQCCDVALALRGLFTELGLQSFAKTSGSKGLQLHVPLNDPNATYEQTKPFAHAVANLLAEQRPELIVSDMAKAKRGGKVLIDWSQNDEHKTTISVYSLRAVEGPRASTPVTWDEVSRCAELREPGLLAFSSEELRTRIHDHGDLYSGVLELHQTCPDLES